MNKKQWIYVVKNYRHGVVVHFMRTDRSHTYNLSELNSVSSILRIERMCNSYPHKVGSYFDKLSIFIGFEE